MEPLQRDLTVRNFQSEQGADVLLLSDVGAQGLNLQRGSVVIFLVSGSFHDTLGDISANNVLSANARTLRPGCSLTGCPD
jgi:hypothetical protein